MDRLKRACENVFQEPRAFLFADLSSSGPTQFTQPSTSPTTLTAPHILTEFPPRKITPAIDRFPDVRLPAFLPPPGSRPHGGGKSLEANYNREVWRDWLMELSEYLSLLLLPSGPADRVKTSDTVDPYLSTYAIDCSHEGSITRIRFSGFIAEKWINQLWSKLVELLDATKLLVDSKQIWAAIAVYGFDNAPIGWNGKEMGGLRGCGNGYAVLRLPEENGEMTWEIVGPQDEY
jgi:ribonuclease P/MRP protein subunit RPP40